MRKTDAAPRIEPRAYPADRAIAIYGIVPARYAGRKFIVDGKRTIVVRWDSVALVTNYVDPSEFSADQIERRRADRKWLRERARHHERVLERLRVPEILPVPFLTTFEDLAALESAVRKRRSRWRASLARIAGKVEYGVHVFSGPHALPEPEPYLLRVSARARTQRRGQARDEPTTEIDRHVARIWEACSGAAVEVRRFETPGARGFALGAAVLAEERDDATLRMMLSALERSGRALGVAIYLEGPRIPYTFG